MTPKRVDLWAIAALALALCLAPTRASPGEEAAFTQEFQLEDCDFASTGKNPLFPLRPGFNRRFEGESDGETVELVISVLKATRVIQLEIDGKERRVRTRVVEERETASGELVEISRNFFATCHPTNDVFYFGEEVDIYEDGEIVSHDGAWRAGVDGALPGLVMPGRFLLGSRYFQERAVNAMDRSENVEDGLEVATGAGTFSGCVRTIETTLLEPGTEGEKVYCPGLGLVLDGDIELVEFGKGTLGGD